MDGMDDAIDVGWKVGNYLLKYLLSSLPIILNDMEYSYNELFSPPLVLDFLKTQFGVSRTGNS
jgi:hypothetical protein